MVGRFGGGVCRSVVGWLVVVLVVLYAGKFSQGWNFFNFSKRGGVGQKIITQ